MPRPIVISNTAVSLDGKIASPARARRAVGSAEDRRRMRALRAEADAVLVGGSTFRTWGLPLTAGEGAPPLLNAVLTRRGVLPAGEGRFPDAGAPLVVLGGPEVDAAAHAARLGADVVQAPAPTPSWALDELAARGCRRILVEGGGALLAPLLEDDRVDHLHVTLCPVLVGGAAAPTLMDGAGLEPPQWRHLRLASCEVVGDEVFLRYSRA